MAKKRIDVPAKQRRRGQSGSAELITGLSELLRSLGGVLGTAYSDCATPSEVLTQLEAAKTALLEARKGAQQGTAE